MNLNEEKQNDNDMSFWNLCKTPWGPNFIIVCGYTEGTEHTIQRMGIRIININLCLFYELDLELFVW